MKYNVGDKLQFIDTSHFKDGSIYKGPIFLMKSLTLGDKHTLSNVGMIVTVKRCKYKVDGISCVDIEWCGEEFICHYGPLAKNTKKI